MKALTYLPVELNMDPLGAIFAVLTLVIFIASGVFGIDYMKEAKHKKGYYVFYFLAFGAELMLCAASNMITFYLFYELLTLLSVPLVIHDRTREAKMAALKYLFYSMFGAYGALFGIYNVAKYADTLRFIPGGSIPDQAWTSDGRILLITAMAFIVGFGVKAGMWPMHGWLPSAHPVAPSPASAVLSACIVKAGVLGIIRSLWYVMGTGHLKGSPVQSAFMILALITVLMGSALAYAEPVLKKRLAYSTISQVSYILFGLAVAISDLSAMEGAVLHVYAHGFIKAALFLTAGAIIHHTGVTKVEDMRGIGLKMPFTMICYTIVSLGLIGIPPTGGFVSKWYLAIAALKSDIPVFGYLGPVILLISALLTAGYLLRLSVIAFFPGDKYRQEHPDIKKEEPGLLMTIPIATLTLLSVLIGLFPDALIELVRLIFV